MKTTRSSSGMSSSSQFVSDSFELRESALPNTEVDESHEVFQSMARNGLSFGSGSESSPSLSSSFDFMDIPKENPLPYGLPLLDDSFSGHRSTKGILSQTQDTPFIADTLAGNNINSSIQWSMGVENESWHPHYHSDRLEWSVPSTLTFSSWPISENMDLSCQDTQLTSPYNFTHDNLQSTNNKHTTLPSAPIPGKPDHSSITALGMGTLQAHPSFNDSPTYTSLPSMAEYNTSFPTPGSSTIHPEPPQLQPENKAIKASLHYSDARNALLIEWKRAGLSYKDIKRIGGFKEAESTLRGRFRTLTKAKEQRVRKPTWLKRDVSMHGTKASRLLRNMDQSLTRTLREYQIQLLCEAVAICTGPVSKSSTGYTSLAQVNMAMAMTGQPPKVSWKKVAQYIWSHGGSYQFGNATCKKKWCDIMGLRSERST
ncbi:hypothetical protein F1880_007871 [Penicillium rolfsii]|nr:hypothetical protein F1880_007871 [Penicillium rolfsii]